MNTEHVHAKRRQRPCVVRGNEEEEEEEEEAVRDSCFIHSAEENREKLFTQELIQLLWSGGLK